MATALFKYWCSIQVMDLGTFIFSVKSVSNLIWNDVNFWMSGDSRSRNCAPCDNRFTHSGTIYSYVTCVSVRGFPQQDNCWCIGKKGWKFMKNPDKDPKFVLLNSFGWSLVFHSVFFSNSVAVIAWAVFLQCFSHRKPPTPQSQAPSQALTLLYIGGASSTSSLLSCQEVDGAGETRRARILPPERRSGEMQWGSMSYGEVEVLMDGSPWCGWTVRQMGSISVESSFCRTQVSWIPIENRAIWGQSSTAIRVPHGHALYLMSRGASERYK